MGLFVLGQSWGKGSLGLSWQKLTVSYQHASTFNSQDSLRQQNYRTCQPRLEPSFSSPGTIVAKADLMAGQSAVSNTRVCEMLQSDDIMDRTKVQHPSVVDIACLERLRCATKLSQPCASFQHFFRKSSSLHEVYCWGSGA